MSRPPSHGHRSEKVMQVERGNDGQQGGNGVEEARQENVPRAGDARRSGAAEPAVGMLHSWFCCGTRNGALNMDTMVADASKVRRSMEKRRGGPEREKNRRKVRPGFGGKRHAGTYFIVQPWC